MDIDLDEISNQAVAALKSIGRKRVSMQATVALELVRRLRAAEAEAMKSERRAIEFGDIVHRYTLAMRAAVVAAHLEGFDHGMRWIYNTLAEHEAFRAAHPAPAVESRKSRG